MGEPDGSALILFHCPLKNELPEGSGRPMSGEKNLGHRTTLQTTQQKNCAIHAATKLVKNQRIFQLDGYCDVMRYAPMSEATDMPRHARPMMSCLSCSTVQ